MRARIMDSAMRPILHDEPSVHHKIQCTFTDTGNWFMTDMLLLIIDAANDAAADRIRRSTYLRHPEQCQLFEPAICRSRAPLTSINGALC